MLNALCVLIWWVALKMIYKGTRHLSWKLHTSKQGFWLIHQSVKSPYMPVVSCHETGCEHAHSRMLTGSNVNKCRTRHLCKSVFFWINLMIIRCQSVNQVIVTIPHFIGNCPITVQSHWCLRLCSCFQSGWRCCLRGSTVGLLTVYLQPISPVLSSSLQKNLSE